MTRQEVVTMLNTLFSAFDVLVDIYDLSKIKTIGGCYMESSVPLVKNDDTAFNWVCYFAQEMLDAIGEGIAQGPSFSKPKGGKRALSKRSSLRGKYENIQELLNSIHIDDESSASDCTCLNMSDDDFSIPTMRLPLTARTA
jgi:Adenylate and Guanylate cyclase catalytic domain